MSRGAARLQEIPRGRLLGRSLRSRPGSLKACPRGALHRVNAAVLGLRPRLLHLPTSPLAVLSDSRFRKPRSPPGCFTGSSCGEVDRRRRARQHHERVLASVRNIAAGNCGVRRLAGWQL